MNSSIGAGELNDIKRTIENVKKSLDEFCSPDMEDSPEITSKKVLQTPLPPPLLLQKVPNKSNRGSPLSDPVRTPCAC